VQGAHQRAEADRERLALGRGHGREQLQVPTAMGGGQRRRGGTAAVGEAELVEAAVGGVALARDQAAALEADMIARAERNARAAGLADRIALRVGDAADLPYPDDSFDLVVSTLSMHHWKDVEPVLGELARVLRPGGRLWIYDFRSSPAHGLTESFPAFDGRPMLREPVRYGRVPLHARFARFAITKPSPAS
jgi:SAM-dependent methyltransferase